MKLPRRRDKKGIATKSKRKQKFKVENPIEDKFIISNGEQIFVLDIHDNEIQITGKGLDCFVVRPLSSNSVSLISTQFSNILKLKE
jgi:hypothetical protein